MSPLISALAYDAAVAGLAAGTWASDPRFAEDGVLRFLDRPSPKAVAYHAACPWVREEIARDPRSDETVFDRGHGLRKTVAAIPGIAETISETAKKLRKGLLEKLERDYFQKMRTAGFEEVAARRWTSSIMRNLGKQIKQRDSMRMSKDLVSLWSALAEATNDKERSAVAERIVELDGRWNSAELSSSKLFDAARRIIRERVEKSWAQVSSFAAPAVASRKLRGPLSGIGTNNDSLRAVPRHGLMRIDSHHCCSPTARRDPGLRFMVICGSQQLLVVHATAGSG